MSANKSGIENLIEQLDLHLSTEKTERLIKAWGQLKNEGISDVEWILEDELAEQNRLHWLKWGTECGKNRELLGIMYRAVAKQHWSLTQQMYQRMDARWDMLAKDIPPAL